MQLTYSQFIFKFLKQGIARKLLTRPIHWWETHQKYPIREKAFLLPPVTVAPDAKNILAILGTPSTVYDAAWAAQSLLRYLPSDIGLTITIDGDLSSDIIRSLTDLFPGIKIRHTRHFLEKLQTTAPHILNLAAYHPLGRKLATILALQQEHHVLYCDADILCFNEVPELTQAFVCPEQGLYIQDVDEVNTDPVLLQKVQELGLDYAQTLNTGLIFSPQNHLDIQTAEVILAGINEPLKSWFGETTILAALLQKAQAKPLPKSRYVVSATRQFYFERDVDYDQIAVRHFVTPVRHLMYSRGLPKVLTQLQKGESR